MAVTAINLYSIANLLFLACSSNSLIIHDLNMERPKTRSILSTNIATITPLMASASEQKSEPSTSEYDHNEHHDVPSLCVQGERTYLSCETDKRKIISICGAQDDGNILAGIYRYGTKKRIELEYPDPSHADPISTLKKNIYTRYGVEYKEISFTRNNHEYRVYSHYDMQEDKNNRSYGVSIIFPAPHYQEINIPCDRKIIDNINPLLDRIPCDTESALGCQE
jgi:hypothetical protein